MTLYCGIYGSTFNQAMACCWNLKKVLDIPKCIYRLPNYNDVIMGAMASQVTSLTGIYSAVYSGENPRKHQSFAPLAFVLGIHRWPVNSLHKWPATRKMFPFDDVIMISQNVVRGNTDTHKSISTYHVFQLTKLFLIVTYLFHEYPLFAG